MAGFDTNAVDRPLHGLTVVERSRTVAAAYAGRLLAALGADVVMVEPEAGSVLRYAPPRLADGGPSALFAYLAAGKRSVVCEPALPAGRESLDRLLDGAALLIDDTPVAARETLGLAPEQVSERFPTLVHVSVLPFGATGPKAHWDGEELNLIHAGGEGFLLPNGYAQQLFPDRPPLQIYGHFGEYQAGAMAAFAGLSALWAAPDCGGQFVDISVQDAVLSVGAFALQRLGDGSLEHRSTRRFRYGGVFEARDGFVELLTLEQRQWTGLVDLLGQPPWAADPALGDPLERSRRGDELNGHIRAWMRERAVDDIVAAAQARGVPAARYRTPDDVIHGEHEAARGLFVPLTLDDGTAAQVLLAPFQFAGLPPPDRLRVPAVGQAERVA